MSAALSSTSVWDGTWDLSQVEELRGMIAGHLARGHRLAVVQIGEDFQVGWRESTRRFADVWGLRLPCKVRALRDATERFWHALRGEDHRLHRHPPPPPRLVQSVPVAWLSSAQLPTLALP